MHRGAILRTQRGVWLFALALLPIFLVSCGGSGSSGTPRVATSASSVQSSAPATTAPSAPTGVSATAGNGEVTVSWTAVAGAMLPLLSLLFLFITFFIGSELQPFLTKLILYCISK